MGKIVSLLTNLLLLAVLITACSEEEKIIFNNPSLPTVSIQIVERTSTSVTLKFLQSDQSTGFNYAIGDESERESFVNNTLDNIQTISKAGEQEVTIEGLDYNKTYTIFARAYDEDKVPGPVALLTVITPDAAAEDKYPVKIETVYATSSSLAVSVDAAEYYKFEYALGSSSDYDAFEKGTLPGIVVREDLYKFTLSYFELDENTDYTFFLRAYRRNNDATGIITTDVATSSKGSGPEVQLSTLSQNIYLGMYELTPNSHCHKFGFIANKKGERDNYINNPTTYNGNILQALEAYVNHPYYNPMIMSENKTSFEYSTPELLFEDEHELYILLYDENDKAVAVQKEIIKTPGFTPNAPEAHIAIEVLEQTAQSVRLKITPDENTLMILYMLIDSNSFQDLLNQGENKIPAFLWDNRNSYSARSAYGTDEFEFTIYNQPGTKSYVIACAMNINGPSKGMTNPVYIETNTLPE